MAGVFAGAGERFMSSRRGPVAPAEIRTQAII